MSAKLLRSTAPGALSNLEIAERLREAARLLRQQQANPFRANAYVRAAATVQSLPEELTAILEQKGRHALEELPGVGHGIAAAICEMLATGNWSQLDRLRGDTDPTRTLMAVPGIGQDLARRIHNRLDISTLEDLEVAAHDGRLASLRRFGPRRLEMVRAGLATLLGRQLHESPPRARPSVAQILDVDAEYREKSAAGRLRLIAPRRFNPDGKAWLPILHTQRGDWHFTALFSNTARAHELGRTHDWVVLYYYDHDQRESQCTVVTEPMGTLKDQRVVRGREPECFDYYERSGG
jgi:putative hydrolase